MKNRTAKEILDKYDISNTDESVNRLIIECAMEEYADQFKPNQTPIDINDKRLKDLYTSKIHFAPIILNWLSYKSQKRQAYKPIGLKTLIKKFNEFNGTYSELEAMVENSIMNNYSGIIWKSNNNNNGKQPKPTREEAINSFLND